MTKASKGLLFNDFYKTLNASRVGRGIRNRNPAFPHTRQGHTGDFIVVVVA